MGYAPLFYLNDFSIATGKSIDKIALHRTMERAMIVCGLHLSSNGFGSLLRSVSGWKTFGITLGKC
jgi:hypothetical protein